MRRFYHGDLSGGRVELDADQSAHARRVLRLGAGDRVELFDGAGTVATARIEAAGRRLTAEVIELSRVERPRPWIDLAVAFPKGGRSDDLVEQASELGADRVAPLLTSRGTVEPGRGKLARCERIAVESAKQCRRPWLLQVGRPVPLDRFCAGADHDLRLIADAAAPGPDDLAGAVAKADRIAVLIGPEGGWTEEERAAARSAGFAGWRLGPHIMRIETAAAAALAILRQHT